MTRKIAIIVVILIVLMILMINPKRIQLDRQFNEIKIKESKPIIIQRSNVEQSIDPDIIKVIKITKWPEEIATYFVSEARKRNVLVFEEALPIAFVESTYRFDAVNHNKNGTSDFGLFQINSVSYPFIIKKLKEENYIFENWNKINEKVNVASGIFWIAYLKNKHSLQGHRLFSSYQLGIRGAKNYASRNGTYETNYSRKVKEIKNDLTKY